MITRLFRYRGWGHIALTLGVLLAFPVASASAQTETVKLAYEAPANCPGKEAFVAQVQARTSLARFADSDYARSFRISITSDADRFSGTLEIALSGEATRRSFEAAACHDLISALALAAALAVDPEARTAPLDEVKAHAVAPPPPQESEPPRPAPIPTKPRPPQPSPSPSTVWMGGVGPAFGIVGGPAPTAMPTVGITFDMRNAHAESSMSLHLTALYGQTGLLSSDDEARFRWFAGRLDLCPLHWPLSSGLAARGCVSAELGGLHAEGRAVDLPESHTRWWAAVGPSLAVDVTPAKGVGLGVVLAVPLPLTHDEFVFENPRRVVHDTPILAYSALVTMTLAVF